MDDGMHNEQLEAGEKAVLEGTSKWECKVQVTGTWNNICVGGRVRVCVGARVRA